MIATAPIIAVSLLILLSVVASRRPSSSSLRVGATPLSEQAATDAASFAISAVQTSDLQSARSLLLDYQGIKKSDSGWTASFSATSCEWSKEAGSLPLCKSGDDRPVTLQVELEDGYWRVGGTSLEATDSALQELLSYRSPSSQQDDIGPRFEQIEIVQDSTGFYAVSFMNWRGVIPSAGIGATCRLVGERNGEVVHTASDLEIAAPSEEGDRDAYAVTGIPDSAVEASFSMDCETELSQGWVAVGQSTIEMAKASNDQRYALVTSDVEWSTEPAPVATLCEAEIMDDGGNLVGSGSADVFPPLQGDEKSTDGSFVKRVSIRVSISGSIVGATSRLSCEAVPTEDSRLDGP
jgi:hypothetical protein